MHYLDPDYNPLEDLPEKEDYRKKVDQFTRDLVWGVMKGYWSPSLGIAEAGGRGCVYSVADDDPNGYPHIDYLVVKIENPMNLGWSDEFYEKWYIEVIPTAPDLLFWGYVSKEDYLLTQKAIDLLHTPSTAPNVFISYRHIASSTLALTIEARLKYLGNNNTFIDKELSPGKRFENEITTAIENCHYFVLLVDKNLFDSEWVIKEYQLAEKLGKTIIPILHPNIEENDLKAFATEGYDRNIQYIDCKGISAADYEFVINRLLNTLGYATY